MIARANLFWHCLSCGAHEPVATTGDVSPGGEYEVGDHEPCITCPDGEAHVMSTRMAAAYEQGLALGMTPETAWERARGER